MNPSPDKRVQHHPFLKTKSFPCPDCTASGVAKEGEAVYVPLTIFQSVRFEGLATSTDVGLSKSDFG